MSVYGTILEYKRFAVHDGDGIRTTLFLKGCPLACRWCHNPEGIAKLPELAYLAHKCIGCGECTVCPNSAHLFENTHTFCRERCIACGKCANECLGGALKLYGKRVSAKEAAHELCLDADFFASSGGGVTLSGGEPLMQHEFCREVFRLVKAQGISTALDTCGYAEKSALDAVLPYTDKVLFDIKAARSETHQKYTGKPNGLILENLRYISSRGIQIEIRIPLIPNVNGGELLEIGQILAPLENITAVRVLPYHGYAATKYESLGRTYSGAGFVPPDKELLRYAKETLESHGLTVILPD